MFLSRESWCDVIAMRCVMVGSTGAGLGGKVCQLDDVEIHSCGD